MQFQHTATAVALALVFSAPVFASGLSGVPGSISGQGDSEQGQSVEDVERSSSTLRDVVTDQVQQDIHRARTPRERSEQREQRRREQEGDGPIVGVDEPASEAPATRERRGTPGIEPVTPPRRASERRAGDDDQPDVVDAEQPEQSVETPPPAQPQGSQSVRYVLPDGMKTVEKDSSGAAKLDGDQPGTHVIKVPPLLFSTIKLPFEAHVETPFPDQVVVKRDGGVLLVAPRAPVPINLILYHPQRPEVSVSLVLLPDGNEIPATLDIAFDESRLPSSSRDDVAGSGSRQPSVIERGDTRQAARFERSADHVSTLQRIHRKVSQGLVPDGYSLQVVTEGATGALCGDRRLIGEFSQRMEGDQFTVDVFTVANAHDDYLTFDESACYRQGIASVQFFPSPTLAPGDVAELIIVHADTQDEAPQQQRRPTSVRLPK